MRPPMQMLTPMLSASPVAAFGFLGSNPGAITLKEANCRHARPEHLSGWRQYHDPVRHADNGPFNRRVFRRRWANQSRECRFAGRNLAGTMTRLPISMGNRSALGAFKFRTIPIDVSGNGGGTVLIRGGNFVLDNSTISANVTGSRPRIDGAETIGHGIAQVVRERCDPKWWSS